jgi:hypothetical protein
MQWYYGMSVYLWHVTVPVLSIVYTGMSSAALSGPSTGGVSIVSHIVGWPVLIGRLLVILLLFRRLAIPF